MGQFVTGESGYQSLPQAVDWVRALLVGTIGTTVAILAVATIGLMMFNGHVPVRRGAMVVIGCFILFSASFIADGLLSGAGTAAGSVTSPSPPAYQPSDPRVRDPYAGAAVPDRGDRDFFGRN